MGEIDDLAATEVSVNLTAAHVMHLRCGYFFTNLLADFDAIRSGALRTVLPLEFPLAWVAPCDIAAMTLLNTSWPGRRIQIVHGRGLSD